MSEKATNEIVESIKDEDKRTLTVFGLETEFDGVLEFSDDLVITGKFNGRIKATGNLEIAKEDKTPICQDTGMAVVFDKPHALTDVPLHYCPGCTHGIIHRLVAECLDELGVTGKTIGVASGGCSVFAYNYFNCDMVQAAHGRAPAVATGITTSLIPTTDSSLAA